MEQLSLALGNGVETHRDHQTSSCGARANAACILFLAVTTCSLSCGHERSSGYTEGGSGENAASSGASAKLSAGAEAGAQSAGDATMRVTAADPSIQPAFSIGLSTAACLTGCPEFDVKIDQSGHIEFNGRGRTRQQGWAGKTTSPQTASDLLDAIRAARYWQLADVYRNQSDGCTDVRENLTTFTWNVHADGVTKVVVDYQGCMGVTQLEAMRRVPAMLTQALQLTTWIGPLAPQ